MPNTTTGHARNRKKKQPRPKREHAYTVLFMTLRFAWGLTKLTLWACLGAAVMFLAIVGMMTRNAGQG